MLRTIHTKVRALPTPLAGLALGISSLGICLENAFPLHGCAQLATACVALFLLTLLFTRFVFHVDTLINDIRHPVLGGIVPTFAMTWMVLSVTIRDIWAEFGLLVWCLAVLIHLMALGGFVVSRVLERGFMQKMVPSWFIPPVGIIVADVTFPGLEALRPFATILLTVGLVSYATLLPVMMYRLMFYEQVPTAAKPTIAIMAAPASLSLAGYLTVIQQPSWLVVAVLLGIALLMTVAIYVSFWKLLRLEFSPGYAAFTFPLVIGATALFRLIDVLKPIEAARDYIPQLTAIAHVELTVACVIVSYVAYSYATHWRRIVGN